MINATENSFNKINTTMRGVFRRVTFEERYILLFLVVYGIIFFIGYSLTHDYSQQPLLGWRIEQMKLALDSIYHGNNLLFGVNESGQHFSIGVSDDRGTYILIPIFAKLFGVTDPLTAYAVFQKAMLFPLLAFYPLVFYFIFRSMIISLISPLLVVTYFDVFRQLTDSYWIQQWILLLSVPIIWLILKRKWSNYLLPLVFIVGFAASISNSVRTYSGMGIAIALSIILFYKLGWKRTLKTAFPVLVISYLLFSPLFIKGTIAYRNHVHPGIFSTEASAHPFFHAAYLGIANGKTNKHGIVWDDNYGLEVVRKVNPNVIYLSEEYNQILKNLYFDLLKKDPMFFVSSYLNKAGLLAKIFIMPNSFIVIVLFLLFVGRKQDVERDEKKFFLVASLTLVIPLFMAALPGMLTIINGVYTLGFVGVSIWFWFLFLFYSIKLVEKRFKINI